MKTKSEQNARRPSERGNVMVYVLIAIALFAALSFTLSRQTDTDEAGGLDEQKAELYATQMISFTAQVKSALDQMTFINTDVGDFDFTLPTAANFNTPPHINKVYHPEGGGITLARLAPNVIFEENSNPQAGWYMGRFNNVEWTPDTATDVLLVAHQIHADVCRRLNLKVTGTETIPAISGGTLASYFVDAAYHSGANQDFEVASCAACENYQSLCVSNAGGTAYSFYNVLMAR